MVKGLGCLQVKKINEINYLYFTYYGDGGKKIDVCCGRDDNPDSHKKAGKMQIEFLKHVRSIIDRKLVKIQKKR